MDMTPQTAWLIAISAVVIVGRRGVQTLRNQADLLASLAAGVLRGFADRLHPVDSATDTERKDTPR